MLRDRKPKEKGLNPPTDDGIVIRGAPESDADR